MLADTKSSRARIRQILVLEDDALIAWEIEQTLLDMGDMNVAVAHSLEGGMALLKKQSFNLAVLDIHLGNDNCFPLAERLARERTPHLFLTGDETVALARRFWQNTALRNCRDHARR